MIELIRHLLAMIGLHCEIVIRHGDIFLPNCWR